MTGNHLDALKEADRARYSAVLYAPEPKREALSVLHLFDLEIARIRSLVSEPLPGEIRLQWWRDVISGERRGEGMANPLAGALVQFVEDHHLPRQAFETIIEGRIADLYDDPFPARADFEAYCGQTRSLLFQMMVLVMSEGNEVNAAEASGHAGCAWGAAQSLCNAAQARLYGQVFIPEDILAATGGSRKAWLEGSDDAFRGRAVEAFAAFGRDHLDKAVSEIHKLPRDLRVAYLPLANCAAVFKRSEKMGARLASEPLQVPLLATQWSLFRMASRF